MASKITPGSATPSQVLSGETFNAGPNWDTAGTMPNNGAVTLTPSGNNPVTIPEGYHNGSGEVSQVDVPASDVLTGTTIAGVAGTMPNQGSPTFTPSASAITLPAGYYGGGTVDAVAVKVASGSETSTSVISGFTVVNGSTVNQYQLSIPVPPGATAIIAVLWGFQSNNGNGIVAFSAGYADGQDATCVCASEAYSFQLAAPLELGTGGILLPVGIANTNAVYAVYYI